MFEFLILMAVAAWLFKPFLGGLAKGFIIDSQRRSKRRGRW